jgi:hypothetical protein
MSEDIATAGHSGDTYGRPGAAARPTSMAEMKSDARDRVRREAAHGKPPSTYRADDLAWAFGTGPEVAAELEELEALADRVAAEKREAQRRVHATGKVRGLAERILADEDKRIRDERMAAAIVEAKRRLGLGLADEPPAKEA